NAYSGTRLKVITNLYYPGYDADNALSTCTDPGTGQRVNKQSAFLPYLARMNWRAATLRNSTASLAPTASRSSWAPTTTRTATDRSTRTACATFRASPRTAT